MVHGLAFAALIAVSLTWILPAWADTAPTAHGPNAKRTGASPITLTGVTTSRRLVQPLIIGHRGSPANAPEETLPSFQAAVDRGADVLELDIQWTKDNQMVALHDSPPNALNRTTNCTGSVQTKTLAEVRRCDAGSWKGKKWVGTKVPTFHEVAALASRHHLRIAPEMKAKNVTAAQARMLAAALTSYGLERRSVVQSFHVAAIQTFLAQSSGIPVAYVTLKSLKTPAQVRAANATYYICDYPSITVDQVQRFQEAGIKVWLYTASSTRDSNVALAARKPNGILTNDVQATKDYVSS